MYFFELCGMDMFRINFNIFASNFLHLINKFYNNFLEIPAGHINAKWEKCDFL
jgi:hypothetical protein